MRLTFKSLFRTMSMLGVAAVVGVTGATSVTCGVGLFHGTGTWCGLPLFWFIGFPLAIFVAIIFGEMVNSFICKFFAGVFIFSFTVLGQAQRVDTRWTLRIMDLKHEVKVEATMRFAKEVAADSCMSGAWRRLIVEEKITQDEKFFPLTGPLSYELKDGELTVGRTNVCDGYMFLIGKSASSQINGTYKAVGIGESIELGYFSLTTIP